MAVDGRSVRGSWASTGLGEFVGGISMACRANGGGRRLVTESLWNATNDWALRDDGELLWVEGGRVLGDRSKSSYLEERGGLTVQERARESG